MLKIKNLRFAADLGLIAFLVFFVGKLIDAWSAFEVPRGVDDYSQLHKVKYILTYWPHLSWNYQWGGGMPLLRWYPPAFYYIVAAIVNLSKSSIELATIYFLYLLYFGSAAGIYALVLRLTGSREVGLLTSVLAIISPSVWDQFVLGGVYSRVAALMLLPLAMWLTVELTGSRPSDRRGWMTYSALVVVLALSVLFNPFFGIPTVAMALMLILFLQDDGSRKVGLVLKLLISVLLLTSFYVIPFFLRVPPNLSLGTLGEYSATRNFFVFSRFPAPEVSYLALSPTVVSFVVGTLILSRFVKTEPKAKLERKTLRFLTVVTFLILLFMATGLFASWVINYIGLAVAIFPFVLAPLAGMSYHRVLARTTKYSRHIAAFVMLSLIGSMLLVSGVDPIAKVSSTTGTSDPSIRVFRQLRLDDGQTLYRIGVRGTEGWIGQWWNYKSDVPQTRDYFFQGILYPEWIAWLNDAVWKWPNNYEEANFLLDWWAVKWILVNSETSDPTKFLSRPEFYRSVANVSVPPIGSLYEFEYNMALPILHATNSPTALVISRGQYRLVLNSLAYSGLSDSGVIPVRGGEYVDDYSIEDLRWFDVILLYGYSYHDRAKAWDLLRQYVELGGGLIIDTGFSPDSNSPLVPLPSPVEKTMWTNFGTRWEFAWVKSPVTEDIDFKAFAPAVSEGAPWGVSSSDNASVRDWARPVLWIAGQPLLAVGQLGRGRVLWSGINLPWHIGVYKNPEEAKLLARAVAWASGHPQPVPKNTNYQALRENPERATVILQAEARGVLFKEFYYPDWKASIETTSGGRQAAPILRAGPDFMYVGVPGGTKYPAKVIFEFDKGVDYLGLSLSAVTLMFLAAYAAVGPTAVAPFSRPFTALRRRIEKWWPKEE